jgi:hypothetical protein
MTWAQRLQRVFGIDVEPCPSCGGAVRIIACIEDPDVIYEDTHLSGRPVGPTAAGFRIAAKPGVARAGVVRGN